MKLCPEPDGTGLAYLQVVSAFSGAGLLMTSTIINCTFIPFPGLHIKRDNPNTCLRFQKLSNGNNQSSLKYRIKEHARLLIFNILPPMHAFTKPGLFINFWILLHLVVYSVFPKKTHETATL